MAGHGSGRARAGQGAEKSGSVHLHCGRAAETARIADRWAVEGVPGMMQLDAYEPIVGAGVIRELKLLGERLAGKKVVNVNSTRVGGGVAEILNRLVPLLNEVGLQVRWEVIHGTEEFFVLTKRMHNALQ